VASHCFNVVADFGPGTNESVAKEMNLPHRHLDSHHNTIGALDNLSGCACVVELCRILAPHQQHFERGLRAVIFTGEEYGYLGSRNYMASTPMSLTPSPWISTSIACSPRRPRASP